VIVNVEHDMEYSDRLARELVACDHPLCTHAYRMHLPRECWAHGAVANAATLTVAWGSEGEEWAEFSGVGFCKIVPSARVAPLERCPWWEVEGTVNATVRGPWHVHWPAVEHYHR